MSEYDINTYRELASNAIEDLKNYADDGNNARLMTSYRAYTQDLERIDSTRAAPDVPELVRYDMEQTRDGVEMLQRTDGDYVRYAQAAAMLVAKDAEIERLENSNAHWINENRQNLKNGQAAESKLATLKAETIEQCIDVVKRMLVFADTTSRSDEAIIARLRSLNPSEPQT